MYRKGSLERVWLLFRVPSSALITTMLLQYIITTTQLPRLEPHILSHLVGTMEPFHKGVFRGDPYYFFKEIFMLTSTD